MTARAAFALLLAGLVACTQPVTVPDSATVASTEPPVDLALFEAALLDGDAVYRVAAAESLVLIRVGRAGPLKNLGHDHVIASEGVAGFVRVAAAREDSIAQLAVPLLDLVVDRDAYRARAGLEGGVPADAVAGPTANMHKVLASKDHPFAAIAARFDDGDPTAPLAVRIEVAGTAADFRVPVDWEMRADRMTASGRLTVEHADFGLEPFSAAGGLLRVAPQIELEFDIVAVRVPPGTPIAATTTSHHRPRG